MNINIQSVNFYASDELQRFAKDKTSKLLDLNKEILSLEVIFLLSVLKKVNNKICEISLKQPDGISFVK